MSNEIPDDDYIVRYCSPDTIKHKFITQTAFQIRPNEKYISVNWIPKTTDMNIGLGQILSALAKKKFHVKANGRFVIFNTGIIKSYVYELIGIKISIFHQSSVADPTHAGLLPIESVDTDNRQRIIYETAAVLSRFTHKHPNSIHSIFGDQDRPN